MRLATVNKQSKVPYWILARCGQNKYNYCFCRIIAVLRLVVVVVVVAAMIIPVGVSFEQVSQSCCLTER